MAGKNTGKPNKAKSTTKRAGASAKTGKVTTIKLGAGLTRKLGNYMAKKGFKGGVDRFVIARINEAIA